MEIEAVCACILMIEQIKKCETDHDFSATTMWAHSAAVSALVAIATSSPIPWPAPNAVADSWQQFSVCELALLMLCLARVLVVIISIAFACIDHFN
jgi:hypothetical protein